MYRSLSTHWLTRTQPGVATHLLLDQSPGLEKYSGGKPSTVNEASIASGQILPAVNEDSACFIGCPSLLPTHTAITRFVVKPSVLVSPIVVGGARFGRGRPVLQDQWHVASVGEQLGLRVGQDIGICRPRVG